MPPTRARGAAAAGAAGRAGAPAGAAVSVRPSGLAPSRLSADKSVTRVSIFGSAPRDSSSFTAGTRLAAAANISAVWPRSVSVVFGLAPASSSAVSAPVSPADAASISAVVPREVVALASAPAFTSACTTGPKPRSAATCSGM